MFTVRDDMMVSLDYTLRLDDGQVADTSEGREPLEFIQGQGNIIPGLEKELYGMALGEQKLVVVAPEDGYGEYDSELLETLPRSVFPADVVLEKGMGFRMRTDTGQVVVAYVNNVADDNVVVDLNHPLAGQTLHFDVRVANLREATPEELEAESSACGCGCESCESGCDEEEGCGCGCEDEESCNCN
jgi:FKBP-type peptidyl-prolyl cis-trans isomerase SlyD